jgi:hypothetical protein
MCGIRYGTLSRHLYALQRKVGGPRFKGQIRKVVFSRLRLGHCTLNLSLYLVGKHVNGLCLVNETVEHVLLYCCKYVGKGKSVGSLRFEGFGRDFGDVEVSIRS